MKNLYDTVADKVVEFCKKTYPYDCFVKFEMSYDGKEWDTVSCVVECDIDYNIIFQWDFCEGQEYIRNFKICHTNEVEPIVRCKDCKYWRYDDCQNDSHGYCPINENDFCSRGERKDESTMGQLNSDEVINYHIENDGTYRGGEDEEDSNSI